MDADSGTNAEIEYLVSDDHFSVDPSGIISNNKQLDADNNNAYYEFIVTAKDKGEPPKTGTATVSFYQLSLTKFALTFAVIVDLKIFLKSTLCKFYD